MCLRVLVESNSQPETKSGNKNGKDWSITQQRVRVFSPGSEFPDSYNFVLPDGVMGYTPGEYIWDVSIQVERGSFDSVNLARGQRLIPYSAENAKYLMNRLKTQFELQQKAAANFYKAESETAAA
jgi:hypothetical protein